MDSPRAGWPSQAPRRLLTRTQINNVTAGRARRENPFGEFDRKRVHQFADKSSRETQLSDLAEICAPGHDMLPFPTFGHLIVPKHSGTGDDPC